MYKKVFVLFLIAVLMLIATAATAAVKQNQTNSYYPASRAPMPESKFSFLPLGAIQPQGWLKQQLTIQANGLTGNLPKFWPDLGPNSGWLGGTGESWERGPYYMDGLIPLAYLLQDKELMTSTKKWVGWTLEHQSDDGWLGPQRNQDWWPVNVMLKVLTQYQEATGDPRVIPAMQKFFKYAKQEMPKRPLGSWGQFRWADMALSVQWLYNRTGDPELLDLAKLMMQQGFDWSKHFTDFKFTERVTADFQMYTHGVNNAMGVKTPGVEYLITGDIKYKNAAYTALSNLDRYHGQATGVFTSDEHYAGLSPSQGTELCEVVEYMFSLENLEQMFGDPAFGDRLEKIAFNALPGTFSADMWQHQYDQQANQVQCKISEDRVYATNGADANIFAVDPHFGCCTSNMHQGWPKLASHLWMATPDNGLAAISYAPCSITAKVGNGSPVTIKVDTNYPFEETVRISIKTLVPVVFPLQLRIPGWANNPTIKVNGELIRTKSGTFEIINRTWQSGDQIVLKLPMKLNVERRFNNSAAITRGPIIYSLKIGEDWKKIKGEEPKADYETYPTTPWNYGLILNTAKPEKSISISTKPLGSVIFSPATAPIELHIKGRLIPNWKIEHNAAGTLPQSPIKSSEPDQELTLIPYGCAKLRITEFPVIDISK